MPTANKPYHHGDLRDSLVSEAIALIAEQGTAALSLRQIAKRAGVSHAAPYRHFADKDALLAAVAVIGFRELARRIGAVTAGPNWMTEAAEEYVRFALSQPAHFHVMFSVPLSRTEHAELGQAGRAALDHLVAGIQRGQTDGYVRAGDAMSLGLAAWSTVHGLASLLVGGALPEPRFGAPDTVRDQVVPVLVAGLSSAFSTGDSHA